MMKKVLALVMVLSMVGFASAALQIEAVGGKAIVTGQLTGDMYLILSAGNGASLSNFALGADAPLAAIGEMQGTAADFAAAGVPVPAGFEGQAWYLASFPGEAYKTGNMLSADLALTKSTVTGDATGQGEWITEGCDKGYHKWRTYFDVIEVSKGALSLGFYVDEQTMGLITDKLVEIRGGVVGTTFTDGACELIPEPLTLSLLGLGALVLRRRS
jgi:hypothetical protein